MVTRMIMRGLSEMGEHRENKEKLRAVIGLQWADSYRFPIVEVILATFLFIGFASVLAGLSSYRPGLRITPGPSWNATQRLETYSRIVNEAATSAYAFSALNCVYVLVLVVPLLVVFSVARGFEDGSHQTMLSYPIRRSTLLLTKVCSIVVLTGTSVTAALWVAVSLLSPGGSELHNLLLVTGSLWVFIFLVVSSTTLISVLSRRAMLAAFLGVSLWYGVTSLTSTPNAFLGLGGVLNPVSVANELINGWGTEVVFADVVLCTMGAAAIALSLLMVSLMLFDTAEV